MCVCVHACVCANVMRAHCCMCVASWCCLGSWLLHFGLVCGQFALGCVFCGVIRFEVVFVDVCGAALRSTAHRTWNLEGNAKNAHAHYFCIMDDVATVICSWLFGDRLLV